MSTETRKSYLFTTPLRFLFGFAAIATLLSNAPWSQPSALLATNAYLGSLMWGVMAAFGNEDGWKRHLTLAIATAYLISSICRIIGPVV
nr:putative integron gene cassette protein [uncultured bacterium]